MKFLFKSVIAFSFVFAAGFVFAGVEQTPVTPKKATSKKAVTPQSLESSQNKKAAVSTQPTKAAPSRIKPVK